MGMSSDKINDTNENINVIENEKKTKEEKTGIQSESVESVQSENVQNENVQSVQSVQNANENNTNEKVDNINVMDRMNYYLNNMSNTFFKFTDSLQKSSDNFMNKFIISPLNTFENTL